MQHHGRDDKTPYKHIHLSVSQISTIFDIGRCFYFYSIMAVQKIFNDDDDRQLTAFFNSKGTCTIVAGKDILSTEHNYFCGLCTLDADDLTELISELTYIRQQINNETI